MKIFVIVGLLLLSASGRTSGEQDDNSSSSSCVYYFIQQPCQELTCNPWPYIQSSQPRSLSLQCHVRGPQNHDLPNVRWYRADLDNVRQLVKTNTRKYSNPASSGHIQGTNYRRINFTLVIHSIDQYDIGCYWCEIEVSHNDCSHPFYQSNSFCLFDEETYLGMNNCSTIPTNDTRVCASSMGCDEIPTTSTESPPTTMISPSPNDSTDPQENSPTPSLLPPQPVDVTESLAISSTALSSSITPVTSPEPNPTTQPADVLSSSSVVSTSSLTSDSQSLSTPTTPTVTTTSSNTIELSSTSTQLSVPENTPILTVQNAGLQSASAVQIGLYIGIGVCVFLLAVILVLVTIVIALCKGKPKRRSDENRESVERDSSSPLSDGGQSEIVWQRDNILPTSLINSSSMLTLLSNNRNGSEPIYSTVQDRRLSNGRRGQSHDSHMRTNTLPSSTRGYQNTDAALSQSLPLLATDESGDDVRGTRVRSHNAQKSSSLDNHHYHTIEDTRQQRPRERRDESQHYSSTHHYHVLENSDPQSKEGAGVSHDTGHRSQSPEAHYYHVLEQPEYYNYNWLTSSGEGRELLLQNWNQNDQSEDENWNTRSVTIDDKTGDESYHWRVVVTSKPGISEGQSSESKGQKGRPSFSRRQPYKRLDQSTIDAFQEYAKVTIPPENEEDGHWQ